MNLIRSIISLFLVSLLLVAVAGWNWAGGLPSSKMAGARFVLLLCGLSSTGCLWLLWNVDSERIDRDQTTA